MSSAEPEDRAADPSPREAAAPQRAPAPRETVGEPGGGAGPFPWVARSRRGKVVRSNAAAATGAASSATPVATPDREDDFTLPKRASAEPSPDSDRDEASFIDLSPLKEAAPGGADVDQAQSGAEARSRPWPAVPQARRGDAVGRGPVAGGAAAAQGARPHRFSLLVVGEHVSAQLSPFRLERILRAPKITSAGRRGGAAAPVWRDLTEEVKAAHLEHRRFGGEETSLRAFAAEQGHAVMEEPRGAVRIGFWAAPQARWERWTIGGAYGDRLRVFWRPGALNQARFGDLDLGAMRAAMRRRVADDYARARANPRLVRELGVDLTVSVAANVVRRLRRSPLLCGALLRDGRWSEMQSGADPTRAVFDDVWARVFAELIADLDPDDLLTIVECQY